MRSKETGSSLVVVAIGMAVLTIGILSILALFPTLTAATRSSHETQVALAAARSKIEEMRTAPLPDPLGELGTLDILSYASSTFAVPGLDPPPNGPQGSITFFNEADSSVLFGRAVDLDLDGTYSENEPVSAAFSVFPVQVDVRWREGTATRLMPLRSVVFVRSR